MKNSTIVLITGFVVSVFFSCTSNDKLVIEIILHDSTEYRSPVYVDIEKSAVNISNECCLVQNGKQIAFQVQEISPSHQRIWWMANITAQDDEIFELNCDCDELQLSEYTWVRKDHQSIQLQKDGKPLIQYEHPVFDNNNREATYKPFHHVFDPETETLITKGIGGLYTHHRGIFFGYNKISINGGEPIDIWHNRNGEHSEHTEIIEEIAGSVLGGHTVKIEWKDTLAQIFAIETRTIRVFYTDNQMIIDFQSLLRSTDGDTIILNGDRQHAGVQFRAANEVSEDSITTFYTRPENLSHLLPTQEIDSVDMIDVPWNAMTFSVNDRQYTVAYLSHPANPNESEMSERLYGRFGEFFPYTITSENPLEVKYRFIVTQGEAPGSDIIQKQYNNYAETVKFDIRKK
jgi:hypothetical protein